MISYIILIMRCVKSKIYDVITFILRFIAEMPFIIGLLGHKVKYQIQAFMQLQCFCFLGFTYFYYFIMFLMLIIIFIISFLLFIAIALLYSLYIIQESKRISIVCNDFTN